MLDRIKFVLEMANELNTVNYQSVLPVMAEYACAASTDGIQVGSANYLADVCSTKRDFQYSVKTYRDNSVKDYILNDIPEPLYTEYIIERRVSGVSDPNASPELVMKEVIEDIYDNERRSANFYNVKNTSTVLLGFSECDNYYYFRLSEFEFDYPEAEEFSTVYFTDRSKNYNKHSGNRSAIRGFIDSTCVYEWVHPNNQSYTRCLKKKYNLSSTDSFYFKIKKKRYIRPSDEELMKLIEL